MKSTLPAQFENVTAVSKANVYFDGRVVSHTIITRDGKKKTLGVIQPGSYRFNTDAAETMEIIAGLCRVRQAGQDDWTGYGTGTSFKVPAKSHFDIAVDVGLGDSAGSVVHYICSFE